MRPKPLLKLGKKTFTVKKGGKGYASIKLSLKSLKLLQKNKTMRAKVIVIVKTSAKTMKVSPGMITLKATKALKTAKLKPPAPTTKVIVDPYKSRPRAAATISRPFPGSSIGRAFGC